mmetsp:Transcript_14812/g.45225  ORF Transcript_14812/g.45225 Transcript_14812/m.45225 type:complete len:134 (+) Transcript_14812:967-1368(+)
MSHIPWRSDDTRSSDFQVIGRGLYASHLYNWLAQFSRPQLLLLNMHTNFESSASNDYYQNILDFLGIPATIKLSDSTVPSAEVSPPSQQDILSCRHRDILLAEYDRWNQILYAMEPSFPRFPPATNVPCRAYG